MYGGIGFKEEFVTHFAEKRPFKYRSTWIIIPIIWGAFALYLYQLDGQSFWRDEILSVGRANQSIQQILSNINIVTGVESPDLHPPFYFLLLSFWQNVIGETEFTYRFISVLMGVLALPLFYANGRRIWGSPSGIWAAFFAALSSFYLWYAQEARMYALLVVESLLVLYTLWPLLFPSPRKRDIFYFGLAIFFAVYTHYTAVFLLGFSLAAIFIAQLLLVKGRLRISRQAILIGCAGLLILCLLAVPLWPNVEELLTASGFIAFGHPSLFWLAESGINTFTQGSTNPPPIPLWQMLPFMILLVVGAFSGRARQRKQAILLTTGGFIGTLLLFYLAGFIQANYSNPRHLMVLSPFLFLLMGHGLATLAAYRKIVAFVVGGTAVFLSSFSVYQTVTAPPVIRDDVRALAAFIDEHAQPGDTVIWHNAVMAMVYDFYESELPTTVIPRYGQYDGEEILATLQAWQDDSERIWFVRRPRPAFVDDTLLYDAMKQENISTDGASFAASWAILSVELLQPLQKVDTLPEEAIPFAIEQEQYMVKGLAIPDVTTTDGGTWATLYWQLTDAPADISPKVCIELLQSDGLVWSDNCTFLQLPTEGEFNEGQLLAHEIWLDVPKGLAPFSYQLKVVFADAAENIGMLTPERPFPTPVLTPIIEYENGLNLVETVWLDEAFQAGFWVLGDLVWQWVGVPEANVQLKARLVDRLGRVIAEADMPINTSDFPDDEWRQGDLVRTRLALPLPYRINGRYRLQIALQNEDQATINTNAFPIGKSWTTLDTLQIADRPIEKTVPADQTLIEDDVLFGDRAIELVAYDMIRDEEKLHVTLTWRNLKELDENYGTFVHVGQMGEPPVAQGGGIDWERPIQSWRKDEIISQTFTITLPEDLLRSDDVVQIGLYAAENPDLRLSVQVNDLPVPNQVYQLDRIPE